MFSRFWQTLRTSNQTPAVTRRRRQPTRSPSVPRQRLAAEKLEARDLLAIVALDPADLNVHEPSAYTEVLNHGMDGDGGQHTVAALPNGGYVVIWARDVGGTNDVYARRFASDGSPLGPEFRVNTTTAGNQYLASVVADANGNFLALWQDGEARYSISGFTKSSVKAQLFNADGTRRGGEFTIGATSRAQPEDVAMDANGNFVVVYHTNGNTFKFYAQRFHSTGTAQGKAISLGETNSFNQEASVAMDATGNFIISWEGSDTVSRFDRLGNKVGTIAFSDYRTRKILVDMNSTGDFAVARHYLVPDPPPEVTATDFYEVLLYDPTGALRTTVSLTRGMPSGIALADDNHVSLVFQEWVKHPTDPTTADFDIALEVYDSLGAPLGAVTANATWEKNQMVPGVALLGNNTLVTVWDENGPNDTSGVFARRFQYSDPTALIAASLSAMSMAGKTGTASADVTLVGWTSPSSGLSVPPAAVGAHVRRSVWENASTFEELSTVTLDVNVESSHDHFADAWLESWLSAQFAPLSG